MEAQVSNICLSI